MRAETMVVIGDSSTIIKVMNKKKTSFDSKIAWSIARIKKEAR